MHNIMYNIKYIMNKYNRISIINDNEQYVIISNIQETPKRQHHFPSQETQDWSRRKPTLPTIETQKGSGNAKHFF